MDTFTSSDYLHFLAPQFPVLLTCVFRIQQALPFFSSLLSCGKGEEHSGELRSREKREFKHLRAEVQLV